MEETPKESENPLQEQLPEEKVGVEVSESVSRAAVWPEFEGQYLITQEKKGSWSPLKLRYSKLLN